MDERDEFIRFISENIYDDAPRLVFADWLDERGEHDLAEFIRVQVELEPIRNQYELPNAAKLHEREDQLWSKVGRLGLFGQIPNGWDASVRCISFQLRRGFPDIVRCSASNFIESGATIREKVPTIRRLVIHCLNGWGERLAACEALSGIPELELACWYRNRDLQALLASLHLERLQKLVIWMGRRNEYVDARNVCFIAAGSAPLPNLQELILFGPDSSFDGFAPPIVRGANQLLGREITRYERGYPELFPLNGRLWHEFPIAGKLSDGRSAIVQLDPDAQQSPSSTALLMIIRILNSGGGRTDEVLHVAAPPEVESRYHNRFQDVNEQIAAFLKKEIGFEPCFIRVAAGAIGWQNAYYYGPSRSYDDDWSCVGEVDDPDNPVDAYGNDPNGYGGKLYSLISCGDFMVGSWGLDKSGRVHST